MSKENSPQSKDDSKSQDIFQRLADVSLRTSATALTILFAYTFAVGTNASMEFKSLIIGVGLLLLFSIIFAVASLFGRDIQEIRYIRGFAITSTILMMIAMGLAFILLVVALFGIK